MAEQRLTAVTPLADALAGALLALDPAAPDSLRECLQRVCDAVASGHICVDLAKGVRGTAAGELAELLSGSQLVGPPGSFCPLILEGTRLYLARYWYYEHRLAASLLRRLAMPAPAVDEKRLAADLAHYFPATAVQPDWQKVAAAAAVLQRVCIVSGGPGTGKTATVLRILAVLQSLADQPLRIALVAPTGKAAARMQEALQQGRQQLAGDLLAPEIPSEAVTLHRLLGGTPDSGQFRHHAGYPLTCDLVVVDEASMIDLSMMNHLLDALPDSTRLILLGDRDQLASVEAGAVFHDLCAMQGCDRGFAERMGRITGVDLPFSESRSPLGNAVMLLQHSYRFDSASGIGALARVINQGDADAAQQLLEAGQYPDVAWLPAEDHALTDSLLQGYAEYWQVLAAAAGPADEEFAEQVFTAFAAFQVLAAQRQGPRGIVRLNGMIEHSLESRGLKPVDIPWYAGRPVMITRNDYGLGLFNGDIGIALADGKGLRVWFEMAGGWRSFAPARLPAHETVYAMTVHKSQGSEFDKVLVILPEKPVELLSRPLLYTAVTRARKAVAVLGEMQVLRTAVHVLPERDSGLVERLAAGL